MSAMTSISGRQGRLPSATTMLKILMSSEEAADMMQLEYHQDLNRARRTLYKPEELADVEVNMSNGNSTFRNTENSLPQAILPVVDSIVQNPTEHLERNSRRPHRFRI